MENTALLVEIVNCLQNIIEAHVPPAKSVKLLLYLFNRENIVFTRI